MNNKIIFWCREHTTTRFYSIICRIDDIEKYSEIDDILLELGIVSKLQENSKYGSLDNWGVIKIENTDEDISDIYTEIDLPIKIKNKYLSEYEMYIHELEKGVKKIQDYNKLTYDELKNRSKELEIELDKINNRIKKIENLNEVSNRKELYNKKGFISESGWIDRMGKWWNVKAVDHDVTAVEIFGDLGIAEQNYIRVSATFYGTYVLLSKDAIRPPNNKQMQTLYKWGKHFDNMQFVYEFEEYLNDMFYND